MNNHKSTWCFICSSSVFGWWVWRCYSTCQWWHVSMGFSGFDARHWHRGGQWTRARERLGASEIDHGWDLVVDLRSLWEFRSTTGVSLSFSLRRFALTGSLFRPLIGSGHLHQGQVSDAFHRTWTSQDRRRFVAQQFSDLPICLVRWGPWNV